MAGLNQNKNTQVVSEVLTRNYNKEGELILNQKDVQTIHKYYLSLYQERLKFLRDLKS